MWSTLVDYKYELRGQDHGERGEVVDESASHRTEAHPLDHRPARHQPPPDGVTKLSGGLDSYRVRVGNYRIVYTIDDGLLDEIEDLRDHLAVYESRNEPTMSFDKLVAELGLND